MSDKVLRKQLVKLLKGGEAHGTVENTVRAYPSEIAGACLGSVPHTPWQLLEHMRIAQWDILEFCCNPDHVSPEFPYGYWPAKAQPKNPSAWDSTVSGFCSDLKAMQKLAANPKIDLFATIPHGQGQTYFREILLVADHNSYHMGQLLIILKGLGK